MGADADKGAGAGTGADADKGAGVDSLEESELEVSLSDFASSSPLSL